MMGKAPIQKHITIEEAVIEDEPKRKKTLVLRDMLQVRVHLAGTSPWQSHFCCPEPLLLGGCAAGVGDGPGGEFQGWGRLSQRSSAPDGACLGASFPATN